MTEQEWMRCTDPRPMLDFLRGKVTDRKLRLFACACCRRVWHLLTDKRSQRAVETAERFADGQCSGEELELARTLRSVGNPYLEREAANAASAASTWFDEDEVYGFLESGIIPVDRVDAAMQAATRRAEHYAAWQAAESVLAPAAAAAATKSEMGNQADLLRDVIGNPFRKIVVEPYWITPAVRHLAAGIYEKRDFDVMPVLADALEEAGCSSQHVLGHCRILGDHVRGCWVMDELLGKA